MTTLSVQSRVERKRKLQSKNKKPQACVICGAPAANLVGGQPSCPDHIASIYERQFEHDPKPELRAPERLD